MSNPVQDSSRVSHKTVRQDRRARYEREFGPRGLFTFAQAACSLLSLCKLPNKMSESMLESTGAYTHAVPLRGVRAITSILDTAKQHPELVALVTNGIARLEPALPAGQSRQTGCTASSLGLLRYAMETRYKQARKLRGSESAERAKRLKWWFALPTFIQLPWERLAVFIQGAMHVYGEQHPALIYYGSALLRDLKRACFYTFDNNDDSAHSSMLNALWTSLELYLRVLENVPAFDEEVNIHLCYQFGEVLTEAQATDKRWFFFRLQTYAFLQLRDGGVESAYCTVDEFLTTKKVMGSETPNAITSIKEPLRLTSEQIAILAGFDNNVVHLLVTTLKRAAAAQCGHPVSEEKMLRKLTALADLAKACDSYHELKCILA